MEYEDKLFALAYEDGVKDKYMCHAYERSERHLIGSMTLEHIDTTAKLHMDEAYSTSHWSQVSAVTEGLHHKCHLQQLTNISSMFMYRAYSLTVGSCYSSSKSRTRTGEQAAEGEW